MDYILLKKKIVSTIAYRIVLISADMTVTESGDYSVLSLSSSQFAVALSLDEFLSANADGKDSFPATIAVGSVAEEEAVASLKASNSIAISIETTDYSAVVQLLNSASAVIDVSNLSTYLSSIGEKQSVSASVAVASLPDISAEIEQKSSVLVSAHTSTVIENTTMAYALYRHFIIISVVDPFSLISGIKIKYSSAVSLSAIISQGFSNDASVKDADAIFVDLSASDVVQISASLPVSVSFSQSLSGLPNASVSILSSTATSFAVDEGFPVLLDANVFLKQAVRVASNSSAGSITSAYVLTKAVRSVSISASNHPVSDVSLTLAGLSILSEIDDLVLENLDDKTLYRVSLSF